jgi:hypothetical protein
MGSENIYERNCVPCHTTLPSSLQQMFKRYLLVYSGEYNVKITIEHYLTHPSKGITLMSDLFINSYGIKQKTTLTKKELQEAINIYWDKFKVFDKLQ